MNAVLTIDLEDWYHCFVGVPQHASHYEDRITSATHRVLGWLEHARATATFFVLGDVALRHPELVDRIAAQGHEIGSHGMRHEKIYRQTPDTFAADLNESLRLLSSITRRDIVSYRAPFFSITNKSLWALDILKDSGIRFDSSVFPVHNHRYGIARARRTPHVIRDGLLEVPPSTYRMALANIPCAGGAYFRLLPHAWTMRMMRAVHAGGDLVLYFHPWEFDEAHPRIRRFSGQGIRHYWGLKKTGKHFEEVVSTFNFASIAECYAAVS